MYIHLTLGYHRHNLMQDNIQYAWSANTKNQLSVQSHSADSCTEYPNLTKVVAATFKTNCITIFHVSHKSY